MATTSQRHYIDITVDAGRAARQLRSIDRNLGRTARAARGMQTSFQRLNATLGILAGAHIMGSLLKGAVRMVDSYNELGGRINLVAESTVGLAKAQEDLNTIAMVTYTAFDATASLYARLGMATKDLGATHEQLIDATQTVANTLRLSGASAQEARSSMLQLSQSMASGVLAGDEYRSISENNVALMDLLAKSLGVTRGELKKMSKDQKLTTEVVFKALIDSTKEYQGLVEGLPITMSRAMTNLETAWQGILVAGSNKQEGVRGLADAVDELAKALNSKEFRDGAVVLVGLFVDIARESADAITAIWNVWDMAGQIDDLNYQMTTLSDEQREYNKLQLSATRINEHYMAAFGKNEHLTKVYGDQLEILRGQLKELNKEFGNTAPGDWEPIGFGSFSPDGSLSGEKDKGIKNPDEAETGTKKLSDLDKYRQSLLDAEKAVDLFFQKQSLLNDMMISGAIGTDTGAEALDKLSPALEKVTSNIDAYIESVKDIDRAEEFWWEQQEALVDALNRGDISLMAFDKSMKELGIGVDKTAEKTATMAEAVGGLLVNSISDFSDSIIDFALTGKQSFADMTKSMLADIAKLILRMQILNAIKSTTWGASLLAADGAVMSKGMPTAFAGGGVVSSPTVFPMANGGIGLMGEAGPEAIMPLTRRNGKLGVAGGGGDVNVIVNNNAPVQVQTESKRNGSGGVDIALYIEKTVGEYFDSGGGDAMMARTYGGRRMPR